MAALKHFTAGGMEEETVTGAVWCLLGAGVGAGGQLPAGTVTVLLAGIEGTARERESGPEAMTAAMARLELLLADAIAGHEGVLPTGQRDGSHVVAAFPAASDAVACALDLHRAPMAATGLRVCVHTAQAERDDDGFLASVVKRAARLLELAHGGQLLLSGMAGDVAGDLLPEGARLADLGSHRLADLGPAERVWRLCHPGVAEEFPPLRSLDAFPHNLPVQLTSFVGREAEIAQVRRLLAGNRLVTLTGAGGVGKTRLALHAIASVLTEFPAGAWQVDLAPLTDSALVPVTVARVLGLPDDKSRSTMATVTSFIAARRALVMLDNCEHLLDACALLAEELLRACPSLVILATSREPVGADGETTWRVPSLPLGGDAIELFADRARRARPGFAITAENSVAVGEICRRLDGIPLAIELAAARLRAFSSAEIATGLNDRFRLLTSGSRTAVRRQQTLLASVDWSHALLTEAERIVFRRLAAFAGGFGLEAALEVVAATEVERHQLPDQLALLVDKSLVEAEESLPLGATRYRLPETIRQYAQEKLGESGEADMVRNRHRDHYAAIASRLDDPGTGDPRRQIDRLETDIDNLRAAFTWSLNIADRQAALQLTSSMQPLWLGRSRMLEGLAWFDAALPGEPVGAEPVAPDVWARAVADAAVLAAWMDAPTRLAQAERAVATARDLGDPPLLGRTLAAAGCAAGNLPEDGWPYFEQAIPLARQAGDAPTLAQIFGWQALIAAVWGDPVAVRSAAGEGLAVAEQIGNDLFIWQCKTWLGWALVVQGDLRQARSLLTGLVTEAEAGRSRIWEMNGRAMLGITLACMGEPKQARALGEASIAIADDLGLPNFSSMGYSCLAVAAMASGDAAALRSASLVGWQRFQAFPELGVLLEVYLAEAELTVVDLAAARQHVDEAMTTAGRLGMKLPLMVALYTSARVAATAGDLARAHDEAYQALIAARGIRAQIVITDILEFLGELTHGTGEQDKAARLLGAAGALRQAIGSQRFLLGQGRYDAIVAELRSSMGETAFGQAWDEGAALTSDEAVSYALRGRGERGRPAIGWRSLTPAERDVARLVGDGLANKEIAARLFVSPRTVQSHLTHVYAKLGVTSRVQLAQQVTRHT